jgi:zinc protease
MADLKRFFLAFALLLAAATAAAQAPRKIVSIEGVTEWRLANGLRILTLPDPSADTVTVHIVYLVGSRHEGYGEKGMAHLLEHLLFKGTQRHPNLKDELTRRGARYNGTTSDDRTNYFETFSATDANLDWALSMEADRMVNSSVTKAHLDSEMTVVRNEFEMGENRPGSVLFQRMQQLAFPWHNYGNPIIGQRADIERVPIGRLRAFYRTWYQPDNAVLIVAGRIDEARAVALAGKHFGAIPRPTRALPGLYTVEPTQDGERRVRLERVGDNQIVSALYRVPAGSDPDYPAVDILVNLLGDVPAGRLHRALVQGGLAAAAWGGERGLHDAGYVYFGAELARDGKLDAARDKLLEVVEGLRREPVKAEEVERARTALLNDFEKAQLESASLVRALSESVATGDWRLFFLYRDRLRRVKLDDVQRVAERYLLSANRVLGEFVPVQNPQRAEIPARPDLQAELQGYKGGAAVSLGEAFDPSPQNIESRVRRKNLSNGIKAALLPKQTRGGRVIATLTLHWGDEKSLTNRDTACNFAGGMLMRGTRHRTRAELKDAFERLNANASVGGGGATIDVRGDNLIPALKIVAEILREPAFPRAEFEEMKRSALTGAESQRNEPASLARVRLERHLHDYEPGHPNYTPTIDEQIDLIRKVTLEDAQACYRELFGATGAEFVAVGDFDADAVAKAVDELLGPWRTPYPYRRVPLRYFERPGVEDALVVRDKANAALRAGINVRMRDDHPDFPALLVANYLLGGTSTGRLPARVREKEGLSYSTYTLFSSNSIDEAAHFGVSSIFAPQNRERVERAIREELERAVREGFGATELENAKGSILQARRLARAQDRALADRLGNYLFLKRTFAWDIDLEGKIAALTPQQVNAALRRHIDPAKLSVIVAGDLKK